MSSAVAPSSFTQQTSTVPEYSVLPFNAQSDILPESASTDSRKSTSQGRRKLSVATDSSNVRRRISRACDQCNQLRTKCDGKLPCLHCVEFSLQCEYARQRKKRGKASRRELAQQAAVKTQEDSGGLNYDSGPFDNDDDDIMDDDINIPIDHEIGLIHLTNGSHEISMPSIQSSELAINHLSNGSRSSADERHDHQFLMYDSPTNMAQQGQYGESPSVISSFLAGTPQSPPRPSPIVSVSTVHTSPPIQSSPQQQQQPQQTIVPVQQQQLQPQPSQSRPQQSQPINRPPPTQIAIPSWFTMVSPSGPAVPEYVSQQRAMSEIEEIALPMTQSQYPFLSEVMLHLLSFMPQSLPVDLLESYFEHNVYCLAPLFRKSSILSRSNPRTRSPALVYAMLLSAAYTSDNPHMTSSPSARQDIIQHLQELCVFALRPLVHSTVHGTLDDVMTYIHLGTVASASEFKGSSLRYWNSAWALARELKLNIEHTDLDDETREEMRRTWWLLFMVDRHLGLCYNRPLAILDSQCMTLYHPLTTDAEWAGDGHLMPPELKPDSELRRGISYTVAGDGIFGFFLPLMTILGGIVELHHLEQYPNMRLSTVTREFRTHYAACLDTFEHSMNTHAFVRTSDGDTWQPYAVHLLNVLRILLAGYWDPLDMLLAPDSLLSSSEFVRCTRHASEAADAIKVMLASDPELMFMPFFFGVYLLHGSFLWLVLVDKLGSNVGDEVKAACETIVRAHEVCIVTLNTEYQRNFRRVMRGALVGMGKQPLGQTECEEGRRRRREIVGLYRWCPGGNGLAV
ncbi:fungal-specific transcription factor domain-containing protein [Lipomyces arxii]|uniref:fungal-specific transcription factor domain-containing protein n=1 Tax=Lipomyces arxii TaxID=56418 RepID=UPI0034CD259D